MIASNILKAIQKKLKRQEISVTYDQIRDKFKELGIQSSEPQPDEISLVVETIQNELALKIVKQEPQMQNSQMTVKQPQLETSLAVTQNQSYEIVQMAAQTMGIDLRMSEVTNISNSVFESKLDYNSAKDYVAQLFKSYLHKLEENEKSKTVDVFVELRNEMEASLFRRDQHELECIQAFGKFVNDTNAKRRAENLELARKMKAEFESKGYDMSDVQIPS